jgi:hypothetical protein
MLGGAVSTAFQSSYAMLTPAARTLFRLLSLVRGPDVSLPAAAALLGMSYAGARLPLDELCATHLVTEHLPGRYAMHDLLRAYATAQANADESPDTLTEATRRLVDFYADAVYEAALLLRTRRDESARDILYPVTERLRFDEREAALEWRRGRRPSATSGQAGGHG